MAAGHQDTFHHVRDFPYFELPFGYELPLPEILGFQVTRYMVVQVLAGILTLLIFRGLSKRVRSGDPPSGWFWNFWETTALMIRDEVVRPTIGEGHEHHGDYVNHATDLMPPETPHDEIEQFHAHASSGGAVDVAAEHPADRFLPFVWSCFYYILFCNLLGLLGIVGSPTANLNVTGPLAVVAFAFVVMTGSKAMGPVGFWKNQVPDMGVDGPLKLILVPMVWTIEVLGLFIKHSVLAVRLFANIMAGHTALGVLVGFIAIVAGQWLFYPVTIASVAGQAVITVLEVLFAFIQAYVFAFLTTVFIGMATHPH